MQLPRRSFLKQVWGSENVENFIGIVRVLSTICRKKAAAAKLSHLYPIIMEYFLCKHDY